MKALLKSKNKINKTNFQKVHPYPNIIDFVNGV